MRYDVDVQSDIKRRTSDAPFDEDDKPEWLLIITVRAFFIFDNLLKSKLNFILPANCKVVRCFYYKHNSTGIISYFRGMIFLKK